MGNVISISKYRNARTNRISSLEYAGVEKYEDMLDIQRGLIEEMYQETERFLKDNKFHVEKFKLDEESARSFIIADLIKAFSGDEESLSLSYKATIGGIEYRTLAEAHFEGETVVIEVSMYKKDGSQWLVYVDMDIWEEGPGEDFF